MGIGSGCLVDLRKNNVFFCEYHCTIISSYALKYINNSTPLNVHIPNVPFNPHPATTQADTVCKYLIFPPSTLNA